MPATYTPTETPARDRRRELDDGGNGRRPPTDKRTGGGGDGDNWNDRKGRRGPRERLTRYRMGLFFALSAVFMFFVAVVGIFVVARTSYHIDANARHINDYLPTLIPPLLWLNTAVLLLSSVTIEMARRHMFREVDVMEEWLGLGKPSTRSAVPWLIATIVLGVIFLTGQMAAWHQLAEQHVYFRGGGSHSFFLMTGVHAAHLLLGVLALMAALTGLYVSKHLENRQILVDCAAWYWHSMGALWVLLFGLLVLCQ